ncbi:MAG: DeoR/GlpR transcriptional regulator [Clostridia bacterium]|nr:DeoR/GlpR transcriptional regulator [Clostridia bacterium]
MISDERKQQIMSILRTDGVVKVADLSRDFGVSEVTVRSYLADMESKGLLSRTHGGAISSYKPYCSMNFNQRIETNRSDKELIAKRISKMIEPEDTVMLNAGTTTLLIFKNLPVDYKLNIVTNSISIALEAASNPNFNVRLVGGTINAKYQFTFGDDAVEQIKKYHADKSILSIDGIDSGNGFSTYYSEETSVDKAMIEQSDICMIAADKSKLRRNAFAKVCDLSAADYIITTGKLEKDEIDNFAFHGITTIVVK